MTARRRTKGAGSVFRDSKGTWHFKRDMGTDPATGRRRFIESRGKTKAEARERFDAKLEQMERTGMLPGGKSPYLEDYVSRWLADYRMRVKPNTYRTRAARLRACCEFIGHVRLADLTPEHIRVCVRGLGERLSSTTLKDHYVSLKMVLDQAELDGLIPSDPCRRVKPPRVERGEVRILGPDQPRMLIEAVSSPGGSGRVPSDTPDDLEMWGLLFELAFTAGMRPGERYALMPCELERRDGVPGVFVSRQMQHYGLKGEAVIPKWLDAEHVWGGQWLTTPKTKAGYRFIPISESLWSRLWARIDRLGIDSRDLVFRTHLGRPVSNSNERNHWRRALEAAGLPDVKLYSARHWMATMTARARMPDDARIAVMGHTSVVMTARYTHRDVVSLGELMAEAIPDLGGDVVEAEVIDDE